MHTHPDADAFIRTYLTRPADATTRLVFADWLDETGEPHNAAWACYIRLRDEADRRAPYSREHREALRQADACEPRIRASLTVSANRFVGYPRSLLQLLPAANITVRLAGFDVPRAVLELVPESVARENVLIPLDLQGDTLLVAAADPHNADTAQKLQFILNRDILFVGAEPDDLRDAIDRGYGQSETESVDSVLVDFSDTAGPWGTWPAPDFDEADAPVVRLVNLMFGEAINLGADRVLVYPDFGALLVRYRIDGEWVERDRPPLRLLRPIFTRIAVMAGIGGEWVFDAPYPAEPLRGEIPLAWRNARFRLRVTLQPSPDGPTAQLDIARDPVV